MNQPPEFAHLFQLPLAERLQLVEDLWDSIAADPAGVPLQEWQLRELRERAARYDTGRETLHDWNEVVTQARSGACGS